MKKILLIIIAFITIVVSANAQSLIEVRGVETKKDHHFLERIPTQRYWPDEAYFDEGFLFTNQNNFSVSVEATLFVDGNEVDAKSFELAPKESYFWCTEPGRAIGLDRKEPISSAKPCAKGYVKYKAFRSNAVPE